MSFVLPRYQDELVEQSKPVQLLLTGPDEQSENSNKQSVFVIDALPYIDTEYQSPEMKQKVDRLISQTMNQMKREKQTNKQTDNQSIIQAIALIEKELCPLSSKWIESSWPNPPSSLTQSTSQSINQSTNQSENDSNSQSSDTHSKIDSDIQPIKQSDELTDLIIDCEYRSIELMNARLANKYAVNQSNQSISLISIQHDHLKSIHESINQTVQTNNQSINQINRKRLSLHTETGKRLESINQSINQSRKRQRELAQVIANMD